MVRFSLNEKKELSIKYENTPSLKSSHTSEYLFSNDKLDLINLFINFFLKDIQLAGAR